MEDKEITLEYIDSIVKSEKEAFARLKQLEKRYDSNDLEYLRKVLNNKVLGKYIKCRNVYMKVTSISQKRTLGPNIDLCGLEMCHPDESYDMYDYQIIPNGTIFVNYSNLDAIEIISKEKFLSEYNKIMDLISKQLEIENTNETNNDETIDKAKSLFDSIKNELNKTLDEIDAIHNKFGEAMYQYCKEHYLNKFISLYDTNDNPSMYIHVTSIDTPDYNGRVDLNGDSIFTNDGILQFEEDSYESIDTSNYRSIRITSGLEFNKAYKNAIKEY